MLEHEQPPLRSDRFPSALEEAAPELERAAVRRTSVDFRALFGLVLVAAAGVWAGFRGLTYYGLSPVHLAYDLDQPPWLLLLVSGWLWYRSRRR